MGRLGEIEGAIFDMDGTLLDSMAMWENMGSIYVKKKGKVPAPDLDEVIKDMKNEFMNDLLNSEKLEKNKFENRKIINKVKESVCRLFSPIL